MSKSDRTARARAVGKHRYAVELRGHDWVLLSDGREVARYPEASLAASVARRLAEALGRVGLRTEVVLSAGSGAEGRRSESEAA